jgi:hypothetical protein
MLSIRKTAARAVVSGVSVFLVSVSPLASGAFAQGTPEKVTREQVAEAMGRVPKGHPVLFADGARFKTLLAELQGSELGSLAFDRLCFDADQLLALPPCTRVMEGRRLLAVSRRALHRLPVLAMAYRLTGKPEYLARCKAELEAVGAFEDWNPSHYLDVAEMTLAVAVAYDWLYDALDEAARARVEEALLEKGLNAARVQSGWVNARNNWGQVCHAGMMAGALALREKHPDLAVDVVHRAVVNLPLSMRASFSPDGCYPEGPVYWGYGTDFNVLALAMLQDVLKTDFGLAGIPGFRETADYLDIVTGPSGLLFNYADCGMGRDISCAMWWFARHLKRPDLLAYHERAAFADYCKRRYKMNASNYGNRLFAFFLPWLQAVPEGAAPKSPLNWSPAGIVPVVVLRSSWDNAKATFIGLKAGPGNGPHGHMDAGSFVLDAEGVRWAYDLGMENYHAIESRGMGLWGMHQRSQRWKILRLTSLSHNTLTLGNSLQLTAGNAKVAAFKDGASPSATLDLSPVYTNAASVLRTATLLPSGEVRLDDALKGLAPGTPVRWAMMTKAAVDDARTGSVTLRENGKQLKLTALHDAKLEWKTEDASAPKNEWDSKNPGMTQLTFEALAPASGEVTFSVLFSIRN